MKPRILITSRAMETYQPVFYLNKNYVDAILRNGGIPFMYTYGNLDEIDEIIKDFDGLLVNGGDDIDSKYFNEPLDPAVELEPPYVDEADLALIRAFHKANKPILGICRGIQIINVAFNGSLIQDLNTSGLNLVKDQHRQKNRGISMNEFGHKVYYHEGSFFYDIFGKEYGANSSHHQAVNRLGEGLKIEGISDDGVIEALTGDRIIAVQYHPEWMKDDPKHNQIFVEFLKMCQE